MACVKRHEDIAEKDSCLRRWASGSTAITMMPVSVENLSDSRTASGNATGAMPTPK